MLLLLHFLTKGESEGYELELLRYLERVPPLNEVDKAQTSVCLQRPVAEFAEDEHDVGQEEKGR